MTRSSGTGETSLTRSDANASAVVDAADNGQATVDLTAAVTRARKPHGGIDHTLSLPS